MFARYIRKKHNADSLTFKHNTIYVLPSTMGTGFIGVSILNFLLGINYQNNLLLAVAYLMVMLLIIALLYGYLNVSGSGVKLISVNSAHCNTPPSITFELHTNRQLLDLTVENNAFVKPLHIARIDKAALFTAPLRLKRGKYHVGQLKFTSHFPFGLVTVWSYLYSDKPIFAYPDPIETNQALYTFVNSNEPENTQQTAPASDEFKQLVGYQPGMNIHRISWKHYAKSQQLVIKEYEGEHASVTVKFDFEQLQGTVEERLSMLCYLVLKAEASDTKYGFKLGVLDIDPASGEHHKIRCLEALSDY
ncbi:DUF58 domain-containing protein [Pseudoalteromonas sp. A25]|uniref:DUF58 domain-containing protein n=1 Tax=Pseudoalteromonas sp. A25 TaxID=116092 RepID=UPI0015624C9C|nr:DUF58 domain-containing protein [Pseudoalteromonas sp. A25]